MLLPPFLDELSSLVLHLLFQFHLIQPVMLGPQPALGTTKEPETLIIIILVVQPRLEGRGTHGRFCHHNGVGANPVMLIAVSPLPHPYRPRRAGIHVTRYEQCGPCWVAAKSLKLQLLSSSSFNHSWKGEACTDGSAATMA
jgi:hypothetical protein